MDASAVENAENVVRTALCVLRRRKNTKMKYCFAILMIGSILFAATGCGGKDSIANAAETAVPMISSQKAANSNAKTDDAEQVKHKVMTFDLEGLNDNGTKKWDVKGQSAESVTENHVKLNNIVASSYGPESQATITADTGMYDKTKNSVHLEQNVKATIENTQKSNAGDFISLPGVTGDASGSKKSEKTADGKPKKTKTTITCEAEVEFNYEKNEAYFNKKVHVVNDEGTIDADKITIHLEPSTKKIERIVAEGNVKIQRIDNTTYSDMATYYEAEKKVVLSGRPKLVIYQEGDSPDNLFGLSPISDKK